MCQRSLPKLLWIIEAMPCEDFTENIPSYWICLHNPLKWEVIQEQEGFACRLRESRSKRNDETLTAHKNWYIPDIYPKFGCVSKTLILDISAKHLYPASSILTPNQKERMMKVSEYTTEFKYRIKDYCLPI